MKPVWTSVFEALINYTGSDRGRSRPRWRVVNSLELELVAVPVSVHSSVPKIPSSETENHRGHSHGYFK